MKSPRHPGLRLALLLVLAIASALVLVQLATRTPRPTERTDSAPASPTPPPADPTLARLSPELIGQLAVIESRERAVAETVWAVESQAASCAAVFEAFWDSLNASTSKWEVIRSFPFATLLPPVWHPARAGPHAIETRSPIPDAAPPPLSHAAWTDWITPLEQAGWSLLQCEFRHVRFDTNNAGGPHQSRFAFSAHWVLPSPPTRAVLEGPLEVAWSTPTPGSPLPTVTQIDARQLVLRLRPGEPPFEPVLADRIPLPRHSLSVDPLLAHDLDSDGFPELLLAARNTLYRRHSDGRFRPEPIAAAPALASLVSAALLGDFDGDHHTDLLVQTLRTLELVPGTASGGFAATSRPAWTPSEPLKYPMTLTAGDIDQDGDLDVFLGQYKEPYEGGASPTPYHAANDGYPAYLLQNDGYGRFTEVTTAFGLAAKRFRRMYSASFADLDADGDLDLLTVSDFAGLDLYRNEGDGHFVDVTDAWVAQPLAFGMAHTLNDFNADGLLDLLMIGMNSPTVDRLEHLDLSRPNSHQDASRRRAMTHGNRLYLARPSGGFEESTLGDSLARSGWSWGCAAADFDNDGFPDVAIGNGLESRESVRDYESEYWLHDQHVGTSEDNPAAYFYFKTKIAQTRGRGVSYGGYEKNRLYLNRLGKGFFEAGHLLGVALEQDSRNLVAEDLDADGRPDLVVLSYEKWPEAKPTLRLFANRLRETGSWIGFRWDGPPNPGTRITLTTPNTRQVREVVAGDSYRSQHSGILHFGLGNETQVTQALIRWPSGAVTRLIHPEINRYHPLPAHPNAALSGTE